MATRSCSRLLPQIVSPALNDSPAGLAAWMLGLIDTGAEDHDVEGAFGGRDELLTNFSLYWFTQTAASAADNDAATPWDADRSKVDVPTGVAIFPREAPSPREWCERQADVVRYTTMPRGGHFAALEVPEDYVGELLAFLACRAGGSGHLDDPRARVTREPLCHAIHRTDSTWPRW